MKRTCLLDHPYYQLDWIAIPPAERVRRRDAAYVWARAILKVGDRLTVSRCGYRKTYTMAGWNDPWIVSASGIYDISPLCVLRINGQHIVNPGLWP
ncbi:MAG: hypothetical protein MUE77_12080 [Sandarakinorhabdus sp.]|nr:hypothetical protein [Sandarakinorhabdus sp.]